MVGMSHTGLMNDDCGRYTLAIVATNKSCCCQQLPRVVLPSVLLSRLLEPVVQNLALGSSFDAHLLCKKVKTIWYLRDLCSSIVWFQMAPVCRG